MGGSSTLPRGGPLLMRAYSPAASAAVSGPNVNSTQSKTLGTPGKVSTRDRGKINGTVLCLRVCESATLVKHDSP